MTNHYVYIIYSASHDVYYKGYSTDYTMRLEQHNQGKTTYTKNKGPWKLVYAEELDSKKEALIKEKILKIL
ncbi:GIY-YIG nuclease family protein [Maribacter sp. SA7]|uniref:GIY-YIG nuclease family protein n=1 Tax=Maribacter zhoushanensis TaxID=3030012 RepID=UPI0023ECCDEA|nr:GIY-YIG nuclease family protein [Maribacter zhoushanensis]MDF4201883.1 GIY-YIG nuclease family protein [Maribacter zhoushanensis]